MMASALHSVVPCRIYPRRLRHFVLVFDVGEYRSPLLALSGGSNLELASVRSFAQDGITETTDTQIAVARPRSEIIRAEPASPRVPRAAVPGKFLHPDM